jgi:Short C-terminal domain
MYRRGPFWGVPFMGGPYMRRRGFPLFPMGGFGMGGMGGSSLLGDLMAGGIGYVMGRQSAQQTPPQQYQAPQYQAPQYQAPQTPQYQAPQYQAPPTQVPAAGAGNERLAQLKLLGHLRDSGLLTNDEFEAEKQKILHGS